MSDTEMHAAPDDHGGRALAAVGLSAGEERVYLALLDHPGATVAELADLVAHTQRHASRILVALEAKGMVTRSLDREVRFQPTPPEAAVDALIAQRQHQLDVARRHAERLAGHARAAPRRRDGGEIVELVSGPDAVAWCWERVHAAAKDEALLFVRPSPNRLKEGKPTLLARRISVRAVYDRVSLSEQGALSTLLAHVEMGEQARVFSPLPIEIVIIDRCCAMIPLVTDSPDALALLLRSCGLLDALVMVFEAIWQRAQAPSLGTAGELELDDAVGDELPPDTDGILPLLATGVKDEVIARELGMSARTMERRVRAMMSAWGAATRFQAGWLAASSQRVIEGE